jgi:hypothetical protein
MSFPQLLGWTVLLGVILGIIFVQAGKGGGVNGGQQTATFVKAAGGASSNIITALESGGSAAGTFPYA